MKRLNEITFAGDRVTVVATANGKARMPVFLFDALTEAPRYTDTLNPANKRERERFLADVDADLRSEVEQLLMRVAAEVATRLLQRSEAATAPSFAAEEPWSEPVDGAALLGDLLQQLHRYVILPSTATAALALWIIHTFVADVAEYTAYILLTSPTRQCGKTTLLELLEHLTFHAWRTDGATAAALYRRINSDPLTLLFDEIDTRLRGDNAEALRGVLNSGYKRDGKVSMCVGDAHEVKDFKTYCPKVLAGIGRPWDTVTSRSIPIRMERATKPELRKVRKVRGHLIADECSIYRRQALRWAMDNRNELRDADPEVPEELGARQADVWRALLAIADAVGGDWPELARHAAKELHGVAEREGDFGLLLLADVRDIVNARRLEEGATISTVNLLEALHDCGDDHPWAEYGRTRQPISPGQVAELLRRFEIRPRNTRQGDQVLKGYAVADLAPSFRRYLPPQTRDGQSGQPTAATPATGGRDVDPPALVAAVAANNGGLGL
jgi:hypothetical protein